MKNVATSTTNTIRAPEVEEEEEGFEEASTVTGNDDNNNVQDNDDHDTHCCAATAAAGDIPDGGEDVACCESFIKVHSNAAEDGIAANDDVIDSNDM